MNHMEKKNPEDGSLKTRSTGLPLFSYTEDEHKKTTGGILFALIVITILLMTAIGVSVRLNEAAMEASDLKSEIQALEKQKREFESELEKKNDMVAFEQYARNNLGMLKGKETETDDRSDKIE